ncbi:hypothetical protein ILUMI_03875, partial [Ignelater luminosus]
ENNKDEVRIKKLKTKGTRTEQEGDDQGSGQDTENGNVKQVEHGSKSKTKEKDDHLFPIQGNSQRWAEYFQEVCGSREEETGGINEEAYTPATEREDPPTKQEIAEIIKKLKNKSSGENRVTAEMLKTGGERLEEFAKKKGCQGKEKGEEALETFEQKLLTRI